MSVRRDFVVAALSHSAAAVHERLVAARASILGRRNQRAQWKPAFSWRTARHRFLAPFVAGADCARVANTMRRALGISLCLLTLNSTGCGSQATREALAEAAANVVLAIGAAALDAAIQEQAEDETEAEADANQRRPRGASNEPGAWRLVREDESNNDDPAASSTERADRSALRVTADQRPPAQRPAISIGRCMVCR